MDRLQVRESTGLQIARKSPVQDDLQPKGKYFLEHWRDGKLIGRLEFHNLVTNEGKNRLWNTMFKGATEIVQGTSGGWYIGLVNGATTPTLIATDAYANIGVSNGWSEFTTYTDDANSASASTRPVWPAGSASGQAITNSSPALFTITTAGTVYGAFIAGGTPAQTKGDHTSGGVLWSEGQFTSGSATVNIGDQLKLTYSASC